MKWRFEDASAYFKKEGLSKSFEELFDEICAIVAKTFIAAEPSMSDVKNRVPKSRNNSFELFGFDILLDSSLKPWILEVLAPHQCNVSPSMNQDAAVDQIVKIPLLTDLMNLIGLRPNKRSSNPETKAARSGLGSGLLKPKQRFTTVKEVQSLTASNFASVLKSEDYLVLLESEEEHSRRGNYRRVYPTLGHAEAFSRCFEVERPNNLLLQKYLQLRREGTDLLRAAFPAAAT